MRHPFVRATPLAGVKAKRLTGLSVLGRGSLTIVRWDDEATPGNHPPQGVRAAESEWKNVPVDIAWSSTPCELAVVASSGWTIEQAYHRCVERFRELRRWWDVDPSRVRREERDMRDRDMAESLAFISKGQRRPRPE